jgi:hypothetical protein
MNREGVPNIDLSFVFVEHGWSKNNEAVELRLLRYGFTEVQGVAITERALST